MNVNILFPEKLTWKFLWQKKKENAETKVRPRKQIQEFP